ncbi:MAG: hypothetical protein GX425_03040 [Peptococcaceae bacterium]|nr:hypothetical protein [Peptococcaceae bacterium]
MFNFNLFKRKKPARSKVNSSPKKVSVFKNRTENQMEIIIGDISLKITRSSAIPPSNELTVIIPRAEIRRRRYERGLLAGTEEILLSSVTLVDSPRHPPEKPAL